MLLIMGEIVSDDANAKDAKFSAKVARFFLAIFASSFAYFALKRALSLTVTQA